MRKKHEEEIEQAEEGFEEQFDDMQAEMNKAKNANMFLETLASKNQSYNKLHLHS